MTERGREVDIHNLFEHLPPGENGSALREAYEEARRPLQFFLMSASPALVDQAQRQLVSLLLEAALQGEQDPGKLADLALAGMPPLTARWETSVDFGDGLGEQYG